MNCGDILREFALGRPSAPAVVFQEHRLSARELLERSFRLANALAGLGLDRQDAVATLGTNALRSVEEITGLAIGGFIRVPLHQGNTPDRHHHMLHHSGARALITDRTGLEECGTILARLPRLQTVIVDDPDAHLRYEDVIAAASADDPRTVIDDDDVIQIGYTGGTTGLPKGAVQTHGRWHAVTMENVSLLPAGSGPHDRMVAAGPLSGAAGSYIFSCLRQGIETIVAADRDAETAIGLIEQHAATILIALPPLVQALAEHTGLDSRDTSSLRAIISAGAPLSSRTMREIGSRFGPILTFAYGQSECLPIAALTPDLVTRGLGDEPELLRSVGRPTAHSTVRIVGDDGSPVPAGAIGEITARTAGDFRGYWHSPDATREKLTADRFVRTGDLGWLRTDGVLFLADRAEDVIRSRGAEIMPSALEDALTDHPAVYEAVVVGVPDDEAGQHPHAIVSLRPGHRHSATELLVWWHENKPTMTPELTIDVSPDPLPRTPAGKLSRGILRENLLTVAPGPAGPGR